MFRDESQKLRRSCRLTVVKCNMNVWRKVKRYELNILLRLLSCLPYKLFCSTTSYFPMFITVPDDSVSSCENREGVGTLMSICSKGK